MRIPLCTEKLNHILVASVVLAGIVSCNSVASARKDEEFEQRKREDDALRKSVEEQKKHHDMSASGEGKTWKHYIP